MLDYFVVDRLSLVQLKTFLYITNYIKMCILPGENVYVGTFLGRSPPNLNTRLETLGLGSCCCCSLFPFDDGVVTPEELLTVIV